MAEFTVNNAPLIGNIALIPNESQIQDVKFYENVVTNRGLRIKVFKNFKEAKKWLEY